MINRIVLQKIITVFTLLSVLQSTSESQVVSKTISLEYCYERSKQYYPLAKQRNIIKQSAEYTIDNITKANFPQITLAGQATYQSDVTSLPLKIPGMSIPSLEKDQYKLFGEISQPLLDWYMVNRQIDLQESSAFVEEQKLNVELFKLKERINQIFFGILLIDEQRKQVQILKDDVQASINTLSAAYANGTALQSQVDVLKAEMLKVNQRAIELSSSRNAYARMLELFINQPVVSATVLELPSLLTIRNSITRPELALFHLQKKSHDAQENLLMAKNLPRIGLFFQSGYGRPALNIMNNDFNYYYIGGIRLSWPLSVFYTFGKEKELINLSRNQIDVQRESFLFNTTVTLQQQRAEITKLEELLDVDSDIILLRTAVKNSSKTQLENGAITANDYVRDLNAEDLAKQNLIFHQVQLLLAQYNYQTTSGN